MQARRQSRPRQTPTMIPVTECTSKESGGEDRRTQRSQIQEERGFCRRWLASLSLTLWGHPSLLLFHFFFLR